MPKIFQWAKRLIGFRGPDASVEVRAHGAMRDRVTATHTALQQMVGVGAVALLLGGAPAQAAGSGTTTYRFTTILDSQDGLVPTRCAAINGVGMVAVQVEDTALGFNKLVTKRGASDAPV